MQKAIQQFLDRGIELPSPPAIAVRILEEIKKEDCSLDGLSTIIETDPALVVKIIKAANSSYYGPVTKVDTLPRALSILGLNAVKNIVLSFVLTESLSGDEKRSFDYNLFWRKSVTAAVSAEMVCDLIGIPRKELFITSLLQDIGMVFMSICSPDQYHAAMADPGQTPMQLTASETRQFGFSHQDVGSYVLADWGFPESIYAPIAAHHTPDAAADAWRRETEILHIAGLLAMIYHGSNAAEVVEHAKQFFAGHFDTDGDKVEALIDAVAQRSIEMLSFFEIPAGEMKPYSQILQDANMELGKLNLSYEQLLLEYKTAKEEAEKLAQELQAANRKLRKLATTDGLTGLYNHRTFQDLLGRRINEANRHQRNLSLILLDLDHFKSVNDSHGHLVGDAILKSISNKIGRMLRAEDIFARYGGEEFALILPETDINGASKLAERIREKVAGMQLSIDGATIQVTVSQGISGISPGLPRIDKPTLIDLADKALYAAKRAGRNAIQTAESKRCDLADQVDIKDVCR